MKRAVDLCTSAVALVVLAPVMAVIAVVVRLSMGSPVFFVQQRAGRDAVPFGLLKFRTMRHAGSDDLNPLHDMDRITRIGRVLRRTSLDELPSLINVLRGDMSLVGPRPLPVTYVARYTPAQARRLAVRPGLTGWAVVHGRNHLGWDERFDLDCWYVDHRSLLLDLRILLRTVGVVFGGVGVNRDERTTMDEFRPAASSGADADQSRESVDHRTDTHG